MGSRRLQVDSIQKPGEARIRPQGAPRDRFFLARSPRLAGDGGLLRGIAALSQTAQAITNKVLHDNAKEDNEEGRAAFDAAFESAKGDRDQLQAAFAKAVAKGELEEEHSPFFAIGYRQTAARSLALREYQEGVQSINELGQSLRIPNPQTGVPNAVPSPEQIISDIHTRSLGGLTESNPGMATDPYFSRQLREERERYAARLMGQAIEVTDAARKANHREGLSVEWINRFQGLGEINDPAVLGAELADMQASATQNIHHMSVKSPGDLVVNALSTAIDRDLGAFIEDPNGNMIPDPKGPERAQRILTRAQGLKIGTSPLSSGTYGTQLQRMQAEIFVAKEKAKARRSAKGTTEVREWVDAEKDREDSSFNRLYSALSETDANTILEEGLQVDVPEAVRSEYREALSTAHQRRISVIRNRNQGNLRALDSALASGDLDKADAALAALEDTTSYGEGIARYKSYSPVSEFRDKNETYRKAAGQASAILKKGINIGSSAQATALAEGQLSRFETYQANFAAALKAAEPNEREAVASEWAERGTALAETFKQEREVKEQEYSAFYGKVQELWRQGESARGLLDSARGSLVDDATFNALVLKGRSHRRVADLRKEESNAIVREVGQFALTVPELTTIIGTGSGKKRVTTPETAKKIQEELTDHINKGLLEWNETDAATEAYDLGPDVEFPRARQAELKRLVREYKRELRGVASVDDLNNETSTVETDTAAVPRRSVLLPENHPDIIAPYVEAVLKETEGASFLSFRDALSKSAVKDGDVIVGYGNHLKTDGTLSAAFRDEFIVNSVSNLTGVPNNPDVAEALEDTDLGHPLLVQVAARSSGGEAARQLTRMTAERITWRVATEYGDERAAQAFLDSTAIEGLSYKDVISGEVTVEKYAPNQQAANRYAQHTGKVRKFSAGPSKLTIPVAGKDVTWRTTPLFKNHKQMAGVIGNAEVMASLLRSLGISVKGGKRFTGQIVVDDSSVGITSDPLFQEFVEAQRAIVAEN